MASSGIVASLCAAGTCIASAITAVAAFNYQLVGFILKGIDELAQMFVVVSGTMLAACGDILHYLVDVLGECGNVGLASLRLVSKFFLLFYHVLHLGICGVVCVGETCAALISGCLRPLLLFAGKLGSNIASTWHHIKTAFAEIAPEYVDSITTSVNRFTRFVNSSLHSGAKCIAATVGAILGAAYDSVSKTAQDCWHQLTLWIIYFGEITAHSITYSVLSVHKGLECIARTFQKHVNVDCYMLLFLATALFISVKIMLDYMHKRDLTLPLFGLRRPTRRGHPNARQRYVAMTNIAIDSSDEETFDDESNLLEVEESSEDSVTTDDDSDSVDEFEVGSDSDESQDSEGGTSVEIQLPPVGGYNLRARKKSPSPSRSAGASPEMTDEEELTRKCVVCQDQPKTVLVLPCKHMCLCIDCAHTIASSRSRVRRVCPLCRGRIHTVMNVYV